MKMNPEVSILIPIYNVSNFIERCAISLFSQTFKDIEYVFVNDATPDDSVEILLKVMLNYPERKDNIKIIHHPLNRGLAAARNTALDASTGKFIAIVDSDDYIEHDMIEVLYKKALIEDADIVVCDYKIEYAGKTNIKSEFVSTVKEENIKNLIEHDLLSSSLWNKLVKRSLYMITECRVPENLNYCEDWYVMIRLFYFSGKIAKVDQPFYHYVQYNTNAITRSTIRMHFENILLFWNSLDEFLREHNLYEKYKPILLIPKTHSKIRLMIDTNSCQLRKEYANMFLDEEKQCIAHFTKGEQLMLYLVRFKLFFLAQMFHKYLVLNNQ